MGSVTSLLYGPSRPIRYCLQGLGNNQSGQIGLNGSPMKDADYIATVSAGVEHSLAITSLGEVFIWGCNRFGQLGNGYINPVDGKEVLTPACAIRIRDISTDYVIQRVSAGFGHTAAITREGLLFTWGLGSDGQLGYDLPASNSYLLACGRERCQLTPRKVEDLTGLDEVACGKDFTLVLTNERKVFVTGSGRYGVLGNGRRSLQFHFSMVKDGFEGRRVNKIAAGWSHCLAAVSGSGVFMWGNPYYDIDETQESILKPVLVLPSREEVLSLACGQNHSAVVLRDLSGHSSLFTWGSNAYFQLGYESEELVTDPRPISFLARQDIHSVTCGWNYTAAVVNEGKLMGWGGNKYSQFGAEKVIEAPAPVVLEAPVEEAVSGYSHLLVLTQPLVRKRRKPVANSTSLDHLFGDDLQAKEEH